MNQRLLTAVLAVLTVTGIRLCGEELGRFADNKIYAQTLVNQTLAQNPDLLVAGLHTIAPGNSDYTMIASNLNSIGEKDGEDDVSVAVEHKIILAPNPKTHDRIEVQLPLQDASGVFIGSVVFVYRFDAKTDRVALLRRGLALSEALARQIPDKSSLFKSTK